MEKFLSKVLSVLTALTMLCQMVVLAEVSAQETTTLTSLTYTTTIAADKVTATTSGLANATEDALSGRTSFYANGVYDPVLITEATQVSVDTEAKTFALTVPYGTEVVNLTAQASDGSSITADPVYMLNDNGAQKSVEIVVGADTYTGTVTWAAASDASIGLVSDIDIYDLKYNQVDLWTEGKTLYNITPSKLVLTPEKDFVIDTAYYNDLIAAEIEADGAATTTVPTALAAGVYVDWDSLVENANETTINQGSSAAGWTSSYSTYARHKLAYSSFLPWVAADIIESPAALNNATLVTTGLGRYGPATASGTYASNAARFEFKAESAGVVYVLQYGDTDFTNDGTWSVLDVETWVGYYSNPTGVLKNDQYNKLYVKNVTAGETVSIACGATAQKPPHVIYDAGATYGAQTPAPEPEEKKFTLSYTTSIAANKVTKSTSGLANATVDATSNNTSIYANGIYDPVLVTEAAAATIDYAAKTFTITVPYGTEVVNLSATTADGETVSVDPVYMLNDNGAQRSVTIVAGEDTYTGTINWAAPSDASIGLVNAIDIYNLQYSKVNLWTEDATIYNITPTKLVLTTEKDFVIDTAYYNDLIASEIEANGEATTTVPTVLAADVHVDWNSLVANANETTVIQGDSAAAWESAYRAYARHKMAYSSFLPWVDAGIIESPADLNNATLVTTGLGRHAPETASGSYASNAALLTFTPEQDGVVYVLQYSGNTFTNTNNAWDEKNVSTLLAISSSSKGVLNGAHYDTVYIKTVKAGEPVSIYTETNNQRPPHVIYDAGAAYDMPDPEPEAQFTMTYTTSIAAGKVTKSTSGLANATVDTLSGNTSIYANGIYDPVLVTEAAKVNVDLEAKTFALTVPYGTEVVNLSATTADGETVSVDPVYMLNDNGAQKSVTVVAGEDTYTGTINWAAPSDASIGLVNAIDIYNLQYSKVNLWTEDTTVYNITPTKLVLTTEKDFVIDTAYYNDLIASEIEANGEATTTVPTALAADVHVDWNSLVENANETTILQNNSSSTAWESTYRAYGRHKMAYSSFLPWVDAGIIESPADLNNATLVTTGLARNAPETASGSYAANEALLTFTPEQDGVVYVLQYSGNAFTDANGEWDKKDVSTLLAISSSSKGVLNAAHYDTVYIKTVKAGEPVSIYTETNNQRPPHVIYDAGAAYSDPDWLSYGYLTLENASGNGYAEVYDADGKLVIEGATEEENGRKFDLGAEVTLKAVANEGGVFSYWARIDGVNESIYSRAEELTIRVPYAITLKAVFKTTAENDYTVSFVGRKDEMIENFAISTVAEDSFTVPSAPTLLGYVFNYYEAEGVEGTYAEGATVAKSSITKDTTFKAVYSVAETMHYTLTVENGTANGETKVTLPYNEGVSVVANAAPEGEKFSHWADADGQILSYSSTYAFNMAAANRTVTAVYVDANATVDNTVPVLTMTTVRVEDIDGVPVVAMFTERRVPENLTVIENGLVYGVISENIPTADSITLENRIGKSTSKYQNNNGQYVVRLKMTDAREAKGNYWYARTYLVYMDEGGNTVTIYSAPKLVWNYEKAAIEE